MFLAFPRFPVVSTWFDRHPGKREFRASIPSTCQPRGVLPLGETLSILFSQYCWKINSMSVQSNLSRTSEFSLFLHSLPFPPPLTPLILSIFSTFSTFRLTSMRNKSSYLSISISWYLDDRKILFSQPFISSPIFLQFYNFINLRNYIQMKFIQFGRYT